MSEIDILMDILTDHKLCRVQRETLEKLIKEKKQREWVKCSERLPTKEECQQNDCRFIITDGNRRYQAWFDSEDCCFIKCNCDGLGLKNDTCVIAWQLLPPAYKEANNE